MTSDLRVEPWPEGRVGDLVALARRSLPDEDLRADDLEWCCFDDPPRDDADGRVGPTCTVGVEGSDGPVGALSLAQRHAGGASVAHVQLLVVDPGHRRRGVARALLAEAERRAAAAGSAALQLGGAAPFYLFTGLDSRWTEALCLAEQVGFETTGVNLDLEAPTSGARVGSSAVRVVVIDEASACGADSFVGDHYPHWLPELRRGVRRGRVLAALEQGRVVGVAAHSVNRAGVVGPVAVHPGRRGAGVGRVLMSELLADLRTQGHEGAEIAWTSTVRFYAIACDARVSRSSLTCTKWL